MILSLKLSVPTAVLVEQPVAKIIADAAHGNFCMLPRHADFLTALVPGVLVIKTADGNELFFANDHGLLVKQGPEVFISVRRAIQGSDLDSLRETVRDKFELMDESDRVCQSAVARLEASFLRKFLEMQKVLS